MNVPLPVDQILCNERELCALVARMGEIKGGDTMVLVGIHAVYRYWGSIYRTGPDAVTR
jgi:hypothetical protein